MKRLKMDASDAFTFEDVCNKIGLTKCTSLTTKKSLDCISIIRKHSKDFGGTPEDPDVMKLCGCSKNSYYEYKKEAELK